MDPDSYRLLLASVFLRVTLRRIWWLVGIAALSLLFTAGATNRVLSIVTLILAAVAALLLMPLRLRQRVSSLTEEDVERLTEIAAASVGSTWRDRLLADALTLLGIAACVVWLPPLAGALIGAMLGIFLTLYQWTTRSIATHDLDRLTPMVRDLVRTRPGLVAKTITGSSAGTE